jgi:hypothetical protein
MVLNMKLVKKVERGAYSLEHHWYYDDFGMKRNSMVLIYTKPDGGTIHMPFWAPVRVISTSKNSPCYGDNVSEFTKGEYEEMLNEEINNYNRYQKNL